MLLLLAGIGSTGCGTGPGGTQATDENLEPPRHILLITLDALRADHLGCYGYPRLTSPAIDSLAAAGVLFSEVQAPRGQTWPSLTSLLTGRYPLEHGVRDNASLPGESLEMLPEILQGSGYRTAAFLANFGDAIYSKDAFGFDYLARSDLMSVTPQDQWDSSMTDEAIRWITENKDRPTFTWVHLMNPHRPYDPPAEELDLLVEDTYDGWLDDQVSLSDLNRGIREGRIPVTEEQFDEFVHAPYYMPWVAKNYLELMQKQAWHLTVDQLLDFIVLQQVDLSSKDLAFILSRYDAEVRAADRCVGRLLETVDNLELRDDTLVILSSDHGDELFDHNHYFFHSASIYQGVLHIPLVLRWPGHIQPATTVDSLAEITDFLPTILQAAGVPQPAGLPGRSLLPLLGPELETLDSFAFSELAHRLPKGKQVGPPMDGVYSVRNTSWKLVSNPSGLQPLKVSFARFPDRSFPIATQELYDLERDPGEQRNLLALSGNELEEAAMAVGQGDELDAAEYLLEASRVYQQLSAKLGQWLQRLEVADGAEQARPISDDVRQRLAALGYMESESHAPAPSMLSEKPIGCVGLVQTALQLTRKTPAVGKKGTPARSDRARNLARQARVQLDELALITP